MKNSAKSLPRESPGAIIDALFLNFMLLFIVYGLIGLVITHFYFVLTSLTFEPEIQYSFFQIIIAPAIAFFFYDLSIRREEANKKIKIGAIVLGVILATPLLMSLISLSLNYLAEDSLIINIIAQLAYIQRYQAMIFSGIIVIILFFFIFLTNKLLAFVTKK